MEWAMAPYRKWRIPTPRDAILACHAAYQRNQRTPEIIAGERMYYQLRNGRPNSAADRALVDRIYAPMLDQWRHRSGITAGPSCR